MSGSQSKIGLLMHGVWAPPKPPPCALNPDAWSDESYYSKHPIIRAEAISICVFSCIYRADCLSSALKEEGSKTPQYRHGIRGGLLPKDRYRIYKRKKLCKG